MPFKKGESGNKSTTFQPGQTGNPNGRPVGIKNRATVAKQVLETIVTVPEKYLKKYREFWPDMPNKMTGEEMISYGTMYRALKRDMSYKVLMDSRYGAPKQEIEHSGEVELGFDLGKISDKDLKTILDITTKAKYADGE